MLECMTLGSFTDNLAIVPHAAAGVIESLHFVNISRLRPRMAAWYVEEGDKRAASSTGRA